METPAPAPKALSQQPLFPGEVPGPASLERKRTGRPRADDDAPVRGVDFSMSLEHRRFMDRECRRLGLTRDEFIARLFDMQIGYATPKLAKRPARKSPRS